MILNIGNTPEGGTHSANGLETIPKGVRRIFTMRSFEISFPLKHPPYMIEDVEYPVSYTHLDVYKRQAFEALVPSCLQSDRMIVKSNPRKIGGFLLFYYGSSFL